MDKKTCITRIKNRLSQTTIVVDGAAADAVEAIRVIVNAVKYAPNIGTTSTALVVFNIGMLNDGALAALDKVTEDPPDFLRVVVIEG